MRRHKILILISVVLFLALVLVGAYFLRKHILERAMLSAVEMGDGETIRRLLKSWPPPVNVRTRTGKSLLHCLVAAEDIEAVKIALAAGANVNGWWMYVVTRFWTLVLIS